MKKKARAAKAEKTATSEPSKKPGLGIAIIALILNIITLPGLGTIIGGKVKYGLLQLLALYIGGIVVGVTGIRLLYVNLPLGVITAILGGVMVMTGWIWAIVSGIMLVKEASS